MEGKKISFGFKMTKKVEKPVVEEKKDFIECLEEKSIKVVGGEKEEQDTPLVIPMKPNTLITAERLKEIAEKVESGLDEVMPVKDIKVEIPEPSENETLDQMAMRELLQQSIKKEKIEKQELTVPVPAKPVMEGEKESTLEDYESVPIQDFGMAMLRGMGWTANKEQLAKYKPPQLRPKGLGLGADKVISDKQKKKSSNKDSKEEELAIIKNSYVKIIAGKHSGYYGKVMSLDEDNGRVMVEITVKKEIVSLSEFMMQPVTKAEFDKESKVINTGAYEEYKKNERSHNQKSTRTESPKVTDNQRLNSPKGRDREASSSQRSNDIRKDRKEVQEESKRRDGKSSNGKEKDKQERSRRDYANEEDHTRRKKEIRRDSSSEERDSRRKKEKSKRNSSISEERDSRRNKEKSKRDSSSSEERDSRRKKEKSRRDSSSSEERYSRKKKEKSRRDSSSSEEKHTRRRKKEISKRSSSSEEKDTSNRRNKERSRRDSSSEYDRKRIEKDKKKYSSNESLETISDSENKKKHKNRRHKDSSESEPDLRSKKDKRDIDKKRKGKKKKRDRDRSPNYKKHRK